MNTSIFLAMCPPNAQEVHIRWIGHNTIESAKTELSAIRSNMIGENRIPMDCYVYEAENPPFNLPIFTIDEVDFNFYRERTPEENKAIQARVESALKLVEQTKDSVNRAEKLAIELKDKVNKISEEKTDAQI